MDSQAGPDRCPHCGSRFECGMHSGRCWCAALPPLPALPAPTGAPGPNEDGRCVGEASARCLCPRCLGALIGAASPEEDDDVSSRMPAR